MKVSKGTIIRTAVLILALVNSILVSAGKSVLPISDVELEQILSDLFMYGAALVAWWKNNSFTSAAIWADKQIKIFKDKV